MSFKTEILEQLQKGPSSDELLAVVRRYKAAGMTQREAYNELEAIWNDFGFAKDSDELNPLRNNLEHVMEVVWGFCPRAAAVWEASLSNE